MPWWVIDSRRNFSGVCSMWRPVALELNRFLLLFLGLKAEFMWRLVVLELNTLP